MTNSGNSFFILFVGTIAALLIMKSLHQFFIHQPNHKERHHYTLALVYSASSISHEYVHKALLEQIRTDNRFSAIDFAVSNINDSISISISCEAALSSPADMIVCTGQACSQALINLAPKRESAKPMFFLGVTNPIDLGIVKSLEKPGNNITGIQSKAANLSFNPITLLLTAKPTIKKLLVPYITFANDSPQVAQDIKTFCAKKQVEVTILPIAGIHDPLAVIASVLPGHDALTYIETDGLVAYSAALGKLASQHNITMFATSIDGQSNAAIGYSSTPTCLAIAGFKLIKDILLNNKNAGEVPVVTSPGFREFIINPHLFNEQGLKGITPQQIVSKIKNDPSLTDVHNLIHINE